jgi:hypothetical protein
MVRRMTCAALPAVCLAVCLAAAPAAGAAEWDRAELADFAFGIVCAGAPGARTPAPDTIAGFVELVDGHIFVGRETARIPALPGLAFGIVARSRTAHPEVTVTVEHPPMATAGATRQVWLSAFDGEAAAANFYRFDQPYERVPGTWRITAAAGGRILYDVVFEVVDPALMPGFTDPCPGPVPVS